MKLILTVFTFLFISANAIWAQSNEQKVIPTEGGKLVECSHGDGHWTFVADEVLGTNDAQASPTGGCPYRPYREMVAYDETLLNTYSKDSIEAWITRAYARFERAMNNSGLTHGGVRLVKIMPVKVEQSYTTLGQLSSFVKNLTDGVMDSLPIIKNQLLDCDHLTFITREGISTSELGLNTQITKFANSFVDKYWKVNTGFVNFITIKPNSLITFAHECGHGVGADHENPYASSVTPSYARSYVDPIKGVSDIMKSGTIASWVVEVFSGPNSKTIKNGETLTIGNDTINNALHVQEVLDVLMCATEQIVTRVSIQATTCGSGTLHAITNNADTFQWKLLSGNCTLGTTSGKDVTYMAMTLSKIQVIGWKQGKWYGDTAVIEIPALQTFPQQMEKCTGTSITLPDGSPYTVSKDTTMEYMLKGMICDSFVILSIKAKPTSASSQTVKIKQGETYTLPDGKKVTTSGTYISKLLNQYGCDSTITTILTVNTATVDPEVLGLRIYPNPVQDNLFIDGLLATDQVTVHDVIGKKQSIMLHENKVNLGNLPSGIYILTIQRGDDSVVMKVLKL